MTPSLAWTRPVTEEVRVSVKTIRDWLQAIAPWMVIIACAVTWFTGGLRPQNQVDIDHLINQITVVQSTMNALKDKIDAMPRPSDYAAQETHLQHIDSEIEALGQRLTADEIRASASDARTQRLIDAKGH